MLLKHRFIFEIILGTKLLKMGDTNMEDSVNE